MRWTDELRPRPRWRCGRSNFVVRNGARRTCAAAGRHAAAGMGRALHPGRRSSASRCCPRTPATGSSGAARCTPTSRGRPVAAAPPRQPRLRHQPGPRPPARLGRRQPWARWWRHGGRRAHRRQRHARPAPGAAGAAIGVRAAGRQAPRWRLRAADPATCSSSPRRASAGRAATFACPGPPPTARAWPGELRADKLDLGALSQIATRLPLGTATHAALQAYAPQGWSNAAGALARAAGALQKYEAMAAPAGSK
jgi:hypothetical protein